ncbi:MAG: hypothetical protein P4M02_10740 [Clostridia bacterium]|nr:hypothetical protein [Clostridia bacterium]
MHMPLRYQIKLNARLILKKKWFKAWALILIIYFLCLGVSALEIGFCNAIGIKEQTATLDMSTVNFKAIAKAYMTYFHQVINILPVNAVFSAITFLLVAPLLAGMIEWYWRLTDNKPQGIGDIFAWFGSFRLYIKSLWLFLNLLLRMLPWALLTFFLPLCSMLYGFYIYGESSTLQTMISLLFIGLGELLLIGGAFLFAYIFSRYFLAVFIFSEDSTRKVNECVKESVRISRKIRGEIFKFNLSFLGWFILLFLASYALDVLSILPALFVVPYFLASCAVFSKYLIFADRVKGKPDQTQDTMEFKV